MGTIFPTLLIFYFIGTLFDTLAWQMLLRPSGRSLPFLRLLLIHIAGESYYRFLPAGVVVGESVKVFMVKKYSLLTTPEIISSLMMRKFLMGIAQALYIGLAVMSGIVLYSNGINGTLASIGLALSVVLLFLFGMMGYFFAKGELGKALFSALIRIPVPCVKLFLQKNRMSFLDTDSVIKESIIRYRRESIIAGILFLLGWSTELIETLAILLSVNAFVTFGSVMVFEPIVSFLRSVVFFIPAGLGIIELGYYSSLQTVSTVGTVAAAFILIKRAKEVFWIVIGVCITAFLGKTRNDKMIFHFSSAIIPDFASASNTVNK